MGVTLAKDVPFAAAYWSVLEPLRSTMLPRDSSASPAQVQPHFCIICQNAKRLASNQCLGDLSLALLTWTKSLTYVLGNAC